MQAVGMIAEFNPLHHGHVYAMQQARALGHADVVVVAMAGNYVQRGEPAIVDKWARTQAALAAGADVVVELPISATVQSAPQFATGGVQLLAALGVTQLAFGSEDPTVDYAALAAKLATHQVAPTTFTDYTQTYATQLNQAVAQVTGAPLSGPNLLLGLSYAQANLAAGSPLTLLPFGRVGAGHDAPAAGVTASASAVRQAIAAGEPITQWVPAASAAQLAANRHQTWADFYPWLRYRLLTADLAELRAIAGMSEGLEYRLTQHIAASHDFPDFLRRIKSKRYTYARLRRLCLAVTLNLTNAAVAAAQAQPFIHVLGFTAAGQAYLHAVKKTVAWPLVTRVSAAMLAPGGLLAPHQPGEQLIETLTGRSQNYGRVPVRAESGGSSC